jgi:proliferating cell nuclear antigen
LKRVSISSSVSFEQEENKLKITIYDKIKRTFTLSLIEVSSEDKDIPELNFGVRVELNSDDFSSAVEDTQIVAESCSFVAKEDVFSIEGSGALSSAKTEFSSMNIEFSGIGKSKYSLEYLTKFIKASKIASKVVLNFSDDYPLRIDFPGEKMGMGFVLAPRVEN